MFSTIIHTGRICDVCLVVLQPALDGSVIFYHLAAQDGNISAVEHNVVPFVLQNLLCVNILCIDHKTRGVSVQTMHHMSPALLTSLVEIVIENTLYIQGRMTSCHRENAGLLLNNYEVLVLIHNADISALEDIVLLGIGNLHLHACFKRKVKLRHRLAIDLDATTLQDILHLIS